MLMLRLKRIGKKKQAAFRLVVGERRSKLKGEQTEELGWYNPHSDKYEFNAERVKYWLSVGAQPSGRVHNLLIDGGILTGKKVPMHKTPKKPASADLAAEASAKEAAVAGKSVEPAAPAATAAPVEPSAPSA